MNYSPILIIGLLVGILAFLVIVGTSRHREEFVPFTPTGSRATLPKKKECLSCR